MKYFFQARKQTVGGSNVLNRKYLLIFQARIQGGIGDMSPSRALSGRRSGGTTLKVPLNLK